MNREDFLDGLKSSYFSEIHECVLECEEHSGDTIDYKKLQLKMNGVWSEAKTEGIKWEEFCSWVQECVPEHFSSLPGFKIKTAA